MTKAPDSLTADGNLPTKSVLADLFEAQAAEIKRLRGERDELEAMAIRAATIAQEQRARAKKALKRAETVLEAWDHHMRDVVVPGSLHDAIEELRADVVEAKGATQ